MKSEEYATKFKKVDLTLIPAACQIPEANVLAHGDSKYARRDYLTKDGYDVEAFRAILRHVNKILCGEQYDQDSGEHHLAHIRANTGIILEFWANHNIEPGEKWPHEQAKPKLQDPPELAPLMVPQSRDCAS